AGGSSGRARLQGTDCQLGSNHPGGFSLSTHGDDGHRNGPTHGFVPPDVALSKERMSVSLDGPRLPPLSGSGATSLIILIHGYGPNGEDLIALARMIQPALPDTAFVAPNAPSQIPRMAAAHQWWPIETFSMAERAAGAAAAAPKLDAFIDEELAAAGLP